MAEESVTEGVNYIVLTDREVDITHAAIPSLLAVSAVHHHLISVGKRVQTAFCHWILEIDFALTS